MCCVCVCCLFRNGLLVVGTGVKAHRATQRSSSLGKTILISLTLSSLSRRDSITFTSAALPGHHGTGSLSRDVFMVSSLYIPIMYTLLHFDGLLCDAQLSSRGRWGVLNRTHTPKEWHWGMGLAVAPLSSPLRCHITILSRISLSSLRVPQPAKCIPLPIHSAELATK